MKTSAIGSGSGFTKTDLGGNLAFGTNLKLGPLANNGGPTLTQLPAGDSPLVDTGSNPASLSSDQRGAGFQRVIGALADIGSTEVLSLVVRNTTNSGLGSLRQTIFHADTHPGHDQITFDPTVFGVVPRTIVLTSDNFIHEETTISGPGASLLTIDGNTLRIFNTSFAPAGALISLSGMTLTGGEGSSGGAIIGDDEHLVLDSCVLTGNTATSGNGGAVFMGQTGVVNATKCSFTNNSAPNNGGAICAYRVVCQACTISGNSALIGGGVAVVSFSSTNVFSLFIDQCTISDNSAGLRGAGIALGGGFGAPTIRNSTISGNSTSNGGAISLNASAGTLIVQNCTITTNNASQTGGAIHIASGPIQLESCIMAQNSSPSGADLSFNTQSNVSANNTIVSVADDGQFLLVGTGNSTGTKAAPFNAKLGPLADNGGPTLTHRLLPGSPAIDAGNNKAGSVTDQRGYARVVGPAADIGAVEIQPPPCVVGKTVTINGGAAQRSRVTSVRIDFDQVVTLPANPSDAIELKRQSDNSVVVTEPVVANDTATHVTLVFLATSSESGSLADGRYTLTVFASKVLGEGGQLDGNCDGTGGDDFVLASATAPNPPTNIFRFFGDLDGDGDVDASNFLAFRDVFLGIMPYNAALDFDGSDSVDAADFLQFRNRFLLGGI